MYHSQPKMAGSSSIKAKICQFLGPKHKTFPNAVFGVGRVAGAFPRFNPAAHICFKF